MSLTLADLTETIDCKLKKMATAGHDPQDFYFCLSCEGRALVKAGSKKPDCLVRAAGERT